MNVRFSLSSQLLVCVFAFEDVNKITVVLVDLITKDY